MENKAITSAQVIFPDNKTLDEKIAELESRIAAIRAEETEADSSTNGS